MSNFHFIDPIELVQYEPILMSLFDSADSQISIISPSEWAEINRIMGNNTGMPGMFSWDNAPYCRRILDICSANHHAKRIAIMKGVQLAMSTSFIQNLIGYNIAENPHNMMLLVGHEDLIADSVERIDDLIDSSGIRHKLKSSAKRARNTKSGDTDKKKEFQDGYLIIGLSNPKTLRQVSIQTLIVDDFDAMKSSSKEDGAITSLIEARLTAFAKKMKLIYASTPTVKEHSNIEGVYLQGNQEKYHIPCQCCGELITLEWETHNPETGEVCGIFWELDQNNKLIPDSVGYKCQICGGIFDDSNKSEWLKEKGRGGSAEWIPTAIPDDPDFYSFHISALYAPIYMKGWLGYVRQYLEACPTNGPIKEKEYQTFVNLCLGLTYEHKGESISASELSLNVRPYEIGTIPEKLSIEDGNGRIVMLTCGSDLNGKEDDARLDYEIIAHSESGATYSVTHGSIGTFIPADKKPEEREHFTYRFGEDRSVWPIFKEIIESKFIKDTTGLGMKIFFTGVDVGHMSKYAYKFVDDCPKNVVKMKGDEYDRPLLLNSDRATFKKSTKIPKLYVIESNHSKDILSEEISLTWDPQVNSKQPPHFMNFPTPEGGKYLMANFFGHFEAEHRIVDEKSGKFVWRKKTGKQNHLFDCRLYGLVARDILVSELMHEFKIKNGGWADYVKLVLGNK
jgi:phage terminase large subunit GpA-like protein